MMSSNEKETNISIEKNKKTVQSAMVEKKIDDGTTNSKGTLPVFIIFGYFIILLISFPYLSDYIGELEEKRKNEEFEKVKDQLQPSPTSTPTTNTENNFNELYDNCGTAEVFTNITINYELKENQCFKINVNNTKSFIKYIPAVLEFDTKWSIYLGEKEIYSNEVTNTNKVNAITILENNTIEMQETDQIGTLVNTYYYDINGNLITLNQ